MKLKYAMWESLSLLLFEDWIACETSKGLLTSSAKVDILTFSLLLSEKD